VDAAVGTDVGLGSRTMREKKMDQAAPDLIPPNCSVMAEQSAAWRLIGSALQHPVRKSQHTLSNRHSLNAGTSSITCKPG
jgi:hypothetical protein